MLHPPDDPRLEPRYSPQAAAELVGVHARTVTQWIRRQDAATALASFADLLALELMKRLRFKHGLSAKRARDAVSDLAQRWSLVGVPQLRVAGGVLWAQTDTHQFLELGTMGQHAIPEVVHHVSQNIELDAEGRVALWYPLDGNTRVVVDPFVRWGAPTVRGTRIPTWAIFDAWRAAGASRSAFEQVADSCAITVEDVEAAVALEERGDVPVAA